MDQYGEIGESKIVILFKLQNPLIAAFTEVLMGWYLALGKCATFIWKKNQPKLLDSQLKHLDSQNSCAKLPSDFMQWCMAHCQRKLMGIFSQAQLFLAW